MRLKKELLFKRKILNYVQSFIIISGTALLLSLAAFLIFGIWGVVIVNIIWFLMIFLIPLVDPKSVLKSYPSRLLSYYEVPNLYDALYNLSKNASLENPPRIYYIKSGSLIAFSTGRKDNSIIALSDGILRLLDEGELYGVLGHEISHIKNNDIWIMQVSDIASKIASIVAYSGQIILILLSPFLLFSDPVYFWVLFIVFLSIPPVSILMQLFLSRIREYGADIDAVMLTGDSIGLKNALLKLEIIEDNVFSRIFNPFSKQNEPSILRTHPDSKKRIKRLEELDFKGIPDEFDYSLDDEFFKTNPRVTIDPKKRFKIFFRH